MSLTLDLTDRVLETPLDELAADASAFVDELAAYAKSADDESTRERTIQIANRSPIRVALLDAAPRTNEAADVVAIVAVPGAFGGHAVRWKRRGTEIDARDHLGGTLRHLPDHAKVMGRGDARMLLTTVLRAVQRPEPASIFLGGGVQYPLVAEMTVGRTALSDVVIADDQLARIAWMYEWSDDVWWVRAAPGGGNIAFNGEIGWERRELSHDDVVASGEVGIRFLLAH